MDRGLHQREAAELIGVAEGSIWNWESGRVSEPEIRTIPAIIEFLGYLPLKSRPSFSDHVYAFRAIHGYTQKDAARSVGIDPTTWRNWESGKTLPRNVRTKHIARQIVKRVVQIPFSVEARF